MYSPKVTCVKATNNPFTKDSDVTMYTFKFQIPKFLVQELNKHRVLANSISSARAIPTKKLTSQEEHFVPEPFTRLKKGMRSNEPAENQEQAREVWNEAYKHAVKAANELTELGVHKQHANRLLEPFSYATVVLSGTEWENFFNLRMAPEAQPEMQVLAREIKECMEKTTPVNRRTHIPFIEDSEVEEAEKMGNQHILGDLLLISAARCARTSYISNVTGRETTYNEDLKLSKRLLDDNHLSPFEHQAFADTLEINAQANTGIPMLETFNRKHGWSNPHRHFNLYGWKPYRQYIERDQHRRWPR